MSPPFRRMVKIMYVGRELMQGSARVWGDTLIPPSAWIPVVCLGRAHVSAATREALAYTFCTLCGFRRLSGQRLIGVFEG
jgi:hypothetical protein